jgi:SLT domain-containing protein
VDNNPVHVTGKLSDWVRQALTHMGLPLSYASKVEYVAMHESSGDPTSVNRWDRNAQEGHPSEGVMQTIQSTFDQFRDPALPNDIFNPVSNIVAALRYAIHRYGSINNIPGLRQSKYVGY